MIISFVTATIIGVQLMAYLIMLVISLLKFGFGIGEKKPSPLSATFIGGLNYSSYRLIFTNTL